MKKLTLLIPANKEAESLPFFLKELGDYNFDKLVVLQREDVETIKSISDFKNIKIYKQKNNGYGNALKEGLNQINTELSDEISKGKYANLAMIAHSSSEFVIDFIQLMPGVPKAKVNSRIIITPEHAKKFSIALNDNISKYENKYDEIKDFNELPKFPLDINSQESK